MEETIATAQFLNLTGDELVEHCASTFGEPGTVSARWEVDGLTVYNWSSYSGNDMVSYLKQAHPDDAGIAADAESIADLYHEQDRLEYRMMQLDELEAMDDPKGIKWKENGGQKFDEESLEQMNDDAAAILRRLYDAHKEEVDRHFLAEAMDEVDRQALLDRSKRLRADAVNAGKEATAREVEK